jgi:hypothetical protein
MKNKNIKYSLDKRERKKIETRNKRIPTKDELKKFCHLNFKEISIKLNMSETKIRKLYKLYGIKRSPKKIENSEFKSFLITFNIKKSNDLELKEKSKSFSDAKKIEKESLPSLKEMLPNFEDCSLNDPINFKNEIIFLSPLNFIK